MKSNYKAIGELVERVDERNRDASITTLIGVSIDKKFIPSVANVIGTDLTNYKVIRKFDFAVSLMQVSRDEKIPVACQKEYEAAIMSPAYPIFRVKDTEIILPEYMEMWFMRSEFDREASFVAVGGVRGSMPWEEFAKLKLPVPTIEEQRKIVDRYNAITDRIALKKQINDNLEAQAESVFSLAMEKACSTRSLGSFGAVVTGKTPPTDVPEFYGGDIPFIKTPDMHGNVYITSAESSLSAFGAESQKNKYLPANTLIVACIGANAGEAAITSFRSQTNQQINAIISKRPCFLYFSVKAHSTELRTLGEGSSTMININKTSFETYEIPVIDEDSLAILERRLQVVLDAALANLREIDKLNEVKDVIVAQLSR